MSPLCKTCDMDGSGHLLCKHWWHHATIAPGENNRCRMPMYPVCIEIELLPGDRGLAAQFPAPLTGSHRLLGGAQPNDRNWLRNIALWHISQYPYEVHKCVHHFTRVRNCAVTTARKTLGRGQIPLGGAKHLSLNCRSIPAAGIGGFDEAQVVRCHRLCHDVLAVNLLWEPVRGSTGAVPVSFHVSCISKRTEVWMEASIFLQVN